MTSLDLSRARARFPQMRRILPTLALVGLATASTGCFHYVPVEEVPRQGTPVQVYTSRPVPVPLEDVTANNVVMVRGEVITEQTDQLALSAFTLESANEFEYLAGGQTVFVPRDALARIEEKRISWLRTGLTAAAFAGAGILIDWGLRQATGGGEGEGSPPVGK